MRVGFGTGPALELEALALELAALAAPALELEALALELWLPRGPNAGIPGGLTGPCHVDVTWESPVWSSGVGFAWLCISGTCLGFGICLDFPAKSELGRLGALGRSGGMVKNLSIECL